MANGPNDTLHYLWDFVDKPSVLMALSPTSTSLHIKWDDYLAKKPGSVVFKGEVTYTFGVIINKVILQSSASLLLHCLRAASGLAVDDARSNVSFRLTPADYGAWERCGKLTRRNARMISLSDLEQ
jgi:hypothetical protein